MDQQGPPTYLPGDKSTLVLQLEHEVNLIKVLAVFRQQAPGRGFMALEGTPERLQTDSPEDDQVKTSEVRLSTVVDPKEHVPGDYLLHEVVAISAEEQELRVKYAERKVAIRIEEEPAATEVRATKVALDQPK